MSAPAAHSLLPLRTLPALCLCLLAFLSPLRCQTSADNIAVLDSLARLGADALARDIALHNYSDLRIVLSEHPAAARLRHSIADRTAIPVVSAGASDNASLLHLYIADYAVRYFLHDDGDSLVREGRLRLHSDLLTGAASVPFPDYDFAVRDTIDRATLPFLESAQYDYARAPVPEQPSGFYSNVAEPLIVVSAALITVLLLFTVRSQ